MKAVQADLVGPRTFELIDTDLSPGRGEVLIEIAACGICSSEAPRYTARKPMPRRRSWGTNPAALWWRSGAT